MKFKPGKWALPLSWLYGSIMQLRNLAYDRQWFRSLRFEPAVISCGNLSVGGTGKSPHTEYLTTLLLEHYPVGILSRGYGRNTKGFVLVTEQESAKTVGDEPWQYHLRFDGADVSIGVAERRAEGIPLLVQTNPNIRAVILDDAYQHRSVKPSQNLLITTFQHPFWRDNVLPAGWLREGVSGAKRANALIISKCPSDLTAAERNRYIKEARSYLRPNSPIFFSTLLYKKPRPVALSGRALTNQLPSLIGVNIGGFCGIATPNLFKEHLANIADSTVVLKAFIGLDDHASFDKQLLDELYEKTKSQDIKVWFCTAKDRAKLLGADLLNHPMIELCWYIPIGVEFLGYDEDKGHEGHNGNGFDNWLLTSVGQTLGLDSKVK